MKTEIHTFTFRMWIESYTYLYKACRKAETSSFSKFLNMVIQEWIENDKKRKELKK